MEEWRDIEGYEGLYQVSNEGAVKSLKKNIILKQKAAEAVNGTSAGISYCCLGGFYSSLREKYYVCENYKGYKWSYKPL